MKAERAQHLPINKKGGRVYLFNNLKSYLHGSFELVFYKDHPAEELISDSLGSMTLRSKEGIYTLFTIGKVTFERFQLFAGALGLRKENNDPCFYAGSLNVN